jgi:uncharacterized membrane protein HdeD (DUF308 family)
MQATPRNAGGDTKEHARGASAVWGGPFIVGLLITFLGALALFSTVVAGLISVFLYGAVLAVVGIAEIVHGIRTRKTGPFLLFLLGGLLTLVVGMILLVRPGVGLAAITLLLAGYFFANGLFRGITSVVDRYQGWGWDVLYGVTAVVLGIVVLTQWPLSALWLVGLMVGIELLFRGFSLMAGALALRQGLRTAAA